MKRLAIGGSIALVALLAGCNSTSPGAQTSPEGGGVASASTKPGAKDPSAIRLGYVSMNMANPWTVGVKKGFEAKCKELGIQCTSIDAQYKVDKQVSDIENLINDGYDGFTFIPIDQNATAALIDTAKSKGIVTASIAQPQDNANLIYTLDEFDYGVAIGTQAGDWIKATLDCKAKVAIISQDNVEAVIPRGNGVEDSIKKICPDVNVVSRQAGDTPEGGMKLIENVLLQHPDLNVVVGTNDSGAIGGYQAMVTGGATGNDRAVFSGDATDEAIAKMQEPNSIYRGTVDLDPYKGGFESAQIMYDWAVNGIPAEPETRYFPYVPVPQEDVLDGTFKKN